MNLTLTLDDHADDELKRLAHARLPGIRRDVVEHTARHALYETIAGNPVDTARSRAAWVASLERLGGTPPADWRGPHPTAEQEGRAQGDLSLRHDRDVTEISAGNAVEYVPFLEYGTSRISPFSMVRRALAKARHHLVDQLQRAMR
jgi:hypothetical protein